MARVLLTYTDFDGTEHEVEAVMEIEHRVHPTTPALEADEILLVCRADGRVVGRKSLAYRERPKR